MTISQQQVADLQPGDVVELTRADWPGVTITGPITADGYALTVAGVKFRYANGDVPFWAQQYGELRVKFGGGLTAYVNHPRPEPVTGDLVRAADDDESADTWIYRGHTKGWRYSYAEPGAVAWRRRDQLPDRLRLLVDGETGRCVP